MHDRVITIALEYRLSLIFGVSPEKLPNLIRSLPAGSDAGHVVPATNPGASTALPAAS